MLQAGFACLAPTVRGYLAGRRTASSGDEQRTTAGTGALEPFLSDVEGSCSLALPSSAAGSVAGGSYGGDDGRDDDAGDEVATPRWKATWARLRRGRQHLARSGAGTAACRTSGISVGRRSRHEWPAPSWAARGVDSCAVCWPLLWRTAARVFGSKNARRRADRLLSAPTLFGALHQR